MDQEAAIIETPEAKTSVMAEPRPRKQKRGWVLFVLFEFILVLATVMVTSYGLLWWRLSQGPFDLSFIKPVAEMVFSNNRIDADVTFDALTLTLPDMHGPLQLDARGVALKKNDETILSVDVANITVAKLPLLWFQIAPISILVEKPSLKFVRRKDNTLDFLTVRYVSPKNKDVAETEESVLENLIYGLWYSRPGEGWSITRNLESLEIIDATAVIDDRLLGMSWGVPQVSFNLQRGKDIALASIVVKLEEVNKKPEFSLTAQRDFITAPTDINLELNDLDITLILQKTGLKIDQAISITGDVNVDVSPLGQITEGRAQLTIPPGRFPLSDILGKTKFSQTDVGETNLLAEYNPGENLFVLRELSTTLNNQNIILSGTMSADLTVPQGYIAVKTPRVAAEEVAKLFPEGMEGKENLEKWVVRKLSKGSAVNLKLGMDVKGVKDEQGLWDFETDGEELFFDFENMSVDYENPLPPLLNAYGSAKLDEGTLTVKVTKGTLGGNEVLLGEGYVTNLTVEEVGEAVIKAKIRGDIKNVLKYIASSPIDITEKDHGLPVTQLGGGATLDVDVRFPTLPDVPRDVFKIGVNGTIENLQMPDVLKNLDLQGGPYNIKVDGGEVSFSGSGALVADSGRWPVTVDYKQPFEMVAGKPRSVLKATGTVDNNFLKIFDVDLQDFFTESVTTTVDFVEQSKGTGIMKVSADLTPTNINVKALNYRKPPGQKGAATFNMHLKEDLPQKITEIVLTAPAGNIPQGEMHFATIGGKTDIASATFPVVKLGRNDLNLDVKKTGNIFKFNMTGKAFDAKGVLEGGNASPQPDQPGYYADLKTDTVYASDKSKLEGVTAVADIRADGVTNLIKVNGRAGKSAFAFDYALGKDMVMRTEDAGAFLEAMGIFPDMIGGVLSLKGMPTKGKDEHANDVAGEFMIANFRVVRTPVLARLINALSLPGLLGMLSNDGLGFTKFAGDFKRETLKTGSVVTTLEDGATSGASIGLTMDGQINNTTKEINIQGTVVPLSEVNSIIGSIPLVGDILTGGGSLIAFTYSITGTTDKQDVFVNPLSALTPGILRRMLFENSAPKVKD